ncbi:hypothetical protein RD136_004585 [Salmonella enterica]|nr:hypothetical protein [Salmonella enterica]
MRKNTLLALAAVALTASTGVSAETVSDAATVEIKNVVTRKLATPVAKYTSETINAGKVSAGIKFGTINVTGMESDASKVCVKMQNGGGFAIADKSGQTTGLTLMVGTTMLTPWDGMTFTGCGPVNGTTADIVVKSSAAATMAAGEYSGNMEVRYAVP